MKKEDLTHGPIASKLFTLASPLALAIAANMSFNLVDTYFIGQLGINQLTAISFSFPVVITLLNLAIGLGIGVASTLSRLLGANQTEHYKTLAFQCAIVTGILSISLALLGVNYIEPLFTALGAKKVHMPYIDQYMKYAYFAMACRMISISISGAFRAGGITIAPSLGIGLTAILNFILDPLLIFGWSVFPRLGIEGAGLATFLANLAALVFEIWLANFRYKIFNLSLNFKGSAKRLFEVFKIGIPSAAANALNPISISIANFILSIDNVKAVAGLGVATKAQAFFMIPVLALSAALGPMVGQTYGFGDGERLRNIMKKVFRFCIAFGALQALVFALFGRDIGALFTDNAKAIDYGALYMRVVGFTLFGYSLVILASSMRNAVNQPLRGFFVIALRAIISFLGSYFLFKSIGILNPVVWAFAASNLIAGSYAFISTKISLKKGF